MVQISPKNIALVSLASLIIGTVASATAPLMTPTILAIAGLLIVIGIFGILFAYYYLTVNIWDAGNRAGAVAFLAFPLAAYQIITCAQTVPLARLAGMVIGSVALTAVAILIGVWAKNLIKQYLFKIPAGSSPPPHPGGSTILLGVIFAVLFLIVTIPVAGSAEYTYPTLDSPRDWYTKDGIRFSYPSGLQIIEGDGYSPNTFNEGMVVAQDPGGHEAATVVWFPTGADTGSPSDQLIAGTDAMYWTPKVWSFARGDEWSGQVGGHTAVYLPFTYSVVAGWTTPDDPILVHRGGYICSWNCPSSGRTIMVILETCGGTDVADEMLSAFLSSAECH